MATTRTHRAQDSTHCSAGQDGRWRALLARRDARRHALPARRTHCPQDGERTARKTGRKVARTARKTARKKPTMPTASYTTQLDRAAATLHKNRPQRN